MTYQTKVKLTDVIAPPFYKVHQDIKKGMHTYYDLYGGRGSTKSSFISVEIILGMMEDKQANAIIYRKVGETIGDSVFEQILWAIDALEVNHLWKCTTSPYRCTYKPTGQKIIFKGLDKAKKSKSAKVSKGYFKYLWFEELDEFAGEEEIRTVQQSILRGGSKFVVFKSFNPPISVANWANKYVDIPRADAYRHKSDYRSVPVEWLGQQFIDDAEHLKKVNPKAYEHEYLGVPVGLGTQIFEFLKVRAIPDAEWSRYERIYQGQDWGWYPDPKAFIRLAYISSQDTIVLLDELGGCKKKVSTMAEEILKKEYDDYTILCGSDEIEHTNDFRDAGLPARIADTRPGSVKRTMQWLQCRKIVIDPSRTPRAYKEFSEYEYEVDKNGEPIGDYPDKNNHWIDAVRYATSPMSLRRGESA